MKINTRNNTRKLSYLLSCLSVTVASMSLANAATTFIATDNQFNNTTTVGTGGGTSFVVDSTSGIGTATYTINYTFTADLTSEGGSAAESVSFSAVFTTADGVIPSQSTIGVDGVADATNNIDSGESVTASISFSPSGLYTGIEFGAIQSYGPGDMEVGGVTKTVDNPIFTNTGTSFTLTNVDPGTDIGNMGFAQFRITAEAVPEPSSVALLGLGGLALILRRKK